MGKGDNLGEFEQTVLLVLAHFGRPVSGRQIYKELRAVTGRDVSLASVHVTLTRLGAKRFVDTSLAPGPQGMGKDIRHFALNARGGRALQAAREHWERLWKTARLHPELKPK